MLHLIILSIMFFVGCFAYRIRGGGWFTLSDSICRLIWGVMGLALPYLFLHAHGANLITYIFTAALIPLAFLDMTVPHAWVQNMGRWTTIQKKWPGFFLPSNWPSPWVAGSFLATLHDFLGMMGVGFFRGLFTFIPYLLIAYFGSATHDIALLIGTGLRASIAEGIITFGQAASYLIGRYTPLTITSSLTAFSSEWGEFWNGGAWVLALDALP